MFGWSAIALGIGSHSSIFVILQIFIKLQEKKRVNGHEYLYF